MAYRDDVSALAARHAALDAEVAETTRQLDAARTELARARLPVLDNLRVASPCRADWSQMTGDDRVRACGSCKKDVYNLSGLTRAQAEALIAARNGELCVRYYQRADGTVMLADCTVGHRFMRRTVAIAATAVGLALAGTVAYHELQRGRFMMGAMVLTQPAAK